MGHVPNYKDHPVPSELQPYFSRIMELNHLSDADLPVPARPTGHCYIGWVPQGSAEAIADGRHFSLATGQCHILGQLSAFDAQYSLHGPATHFLAKFTPMGAYQLLNRDLGALLNVFEIFTPDMFGPPNVDTFLDILQPFTDNPVSHDPMIEKAAQLIASRNGDVSISGLAVELNISDRHLRRKFIQQIGIAPKPYALIRKVLSTLQLLAENPGKEIADIVYDMGYYDQAHLSNVFQLYMRVTPKQLHLDEDGVLQSIVTGVEKSDFSNPA